MSVGRTLVCLVMAGVMLLAAGSAGVQAQTVSGKAPQAIIETKFGSMEIRFFPDKAPKHVENFIKLAKSGFYDKTIFHRVIPGFMIQGGDPNTKDDKDKSRYGMGGPGSNVKAEFNDRPHVRGIVSMARSQDPDSAGSQFFIVVKDLPIRSINFLFPEFQAAYRAPSLILAVAEYPPGPLTGVSADAEFPLQWHA